jgi:hypothetical protein
MPLLLLPPSSPLLALLRLLDLSPLVFFAGFSLAADSSRISSSVLSALSYRRGVLVLAPQTLDVADVVEAGETTPATPDSLLPLLQACDCESHRRLPSRLAAGSRPWGRPDAEVDEAADFFVLLICFFLVSDLWVTILSLSASPSRNGP